MIFGYPAEAIIENWLHECLVEMLQTTHELVQNGIEIPEWPEIIPEEYREKLESRTGLRDRLIAYLDAVETLSDEELIRVNDALNTQNQIEGLLSGACNCETINDLPEAIREPVSKLFEFSFGLLTPLDLRDQQYHIIYHSTPYHICPFCGCEFFDAPGAKREALDHYLPKSKYPFAGTNLQNLVPMGNKCNSRYKSAQDILYDDNGQRRQSFYPYNYQGNIRISLDRSVPFEGQGGGLFPFPKWELDFEPNSEEVSTWDTVFHIRERFERDVLDGEFMSWLREFSSWCKSANQKPNSSEEILSALERFLVHLETMGVRDRSFLKAAMFRMLLHYYRNNHQRLIDLVNGIVIGGMD